MNKVITINLNGNAYQIDEAGHDALYDYLQKAAAKLAGNPDKDEIMADLEQAVADKCAKYLNDKKTVISTQEMTDILAAMGPVEDEDPKADKAKKEAGEQQPAPKRLFKIREGAVFEGVCTGIAAYLNIDVTVVRVLFIVGTLLTWGAGLLVYVLLAIFIPEAKTSEDRAAASGQVFNSQTILAKAHNQYEEWRETAATKVKEWEAKEAEHKAGKHHGAQWKDWKKNDPVPVPPALPKLQPSVGNRIARGIAGWFGGIGVLVLLALSVLWALGLHNLFTTDSILGYFKGESTLILALLLVCTFYLIFLPIQGLVSEALRYAKCVTMPSSFWGKFFTGLLWLGAAVGMVFIISQSSIVRDGLHQVRDDFVNTGHIGR